MILRVLASLILFLFYSTAILAQTQDIETIKEFVQEPDVKMHIYFLASDEFKGRDTGTPHLDIAGRYIATWFMTHGVEPLPGYDDYFQTISFERVTVPEEGEIALGDSGYVYGQDFVSINTARGEFEGSIRVLEYGMGDEIENMDLDGQIVVVKPGDEGQMAPQQWFMTAEEKYNSLKERGAAAVIELYDNRQLPWSVLVQFLDQERLAVAEETDDSDQREIPHIWLNGTTHDLHAAFSDIESADITISIAGEPSEILESSNVLGYIKGTDPDLKDEYVLLGAHYDHIGIDEGRDDGNYIYNGARDNAVGTSGIMFAARYLAEHPPKRSVIFAAWTAEEVGLLGSNYFAENPGIPLEQIIYNLNIDGAGYNDTTKVTVIGLERTEAEDDLRAAAEAFGLEAIPDPVPEQNLFDRSDNVNFARRGIPAPTYSLGFTAFDAEINRFYHTVEDEPDTINYPYVTQYLRSFLLAAKKLANAYEAPFWREGDPYEETGLELYGR